MSVPTPAPRSARRKHALVAAVAILFALLPGMAFAAPGGYTDSGGDGGTSTGNGGGGGGTCIYTTAANGHRVGAGALSNGVRNTEWGDLRCNNGVTANSRYRYGSEDPTATGVYGWCVTGYEVYRFYGDETNKSKSMSVSRLNLTDWCRGENLYFFPQVTPYDQGTGTPSPGAPWNMDEAVSPNGQLFGEAFAQVSRYKGKHRNALGQNLLTTGKPFRFTSGNGTPVGCTAVQSQPDPIDRYFKDTDSPLYVPALAQDLRVALGLAYRAEAYEGTELRAHESGLAVINSSAVANTLGPDTQIAYGDGRPCSSLLDYALFRVVEVERGAGAPDSPFKRLGNRLPGVTNDERWIGTCYIPLTRQAREVRFRNGTTDWVFTTLQHGGGERYSSFYAHAQRPEFFDGKKTPPRPAPNRNAWHIDESLLPPIEAEWRAAMKNDYLQRYNQAISAGAAGNRPGSPYLKMVNGVVAPDANQPNLPVQPYGSGADQYNPATSSPAAKGEAFNPERTSNVLANFSRCRHTEQSQISVILPDCERPPCAPLIEDPPSPTQTITMTTMDAFQVGGKRTQAVVGARVGSFNCPMTGTNIIACSSEQMSYNYEIKAPPGYNLCEGPDSTSVPRECDAMVIEGKKSGTYTSGTGEIKVRLYRATPPKAPLQLVVSEQQGTFTYTTQTVSSGICVSVPTTSGAVSPCEPQIRTETFTNLPYTINVVGEPRRLDAPGVKRVPVIGANNS